MTAWLVEPICLSFNTQPPEGGWAYIVIGGILDTGFNTQPPEGGWPQFIVF